MDNTQKQKQQYLFQQIIQKNYDPEQFQQFLLQSKSGGDDLTNWTYQELKQIVIKFHKKFGKPTQGTQNNQQQEQEQEQKRQSFIEAYVDTEESQRQKSDNQNQSAIIDIKDHFNQIIQCTTLLPSQLTATKDLNIFVTKFEKKEGGIFEQSYVCYFVQTPALHKTVERRYTDFQWLKSVLQWLHPGIPIPPIARKGQFRRYDDKHLRKRMMILEMFLNKLLEIYEIKADPILQNFLTIDDKASFQKYKSNYKPTPKMMPLKKVRNVKGTLITACDQKTKCLLSSTSKHLQIVQPMVKSLYKSFKLAAQSLQTTGSVLKQLGSQCQSIDRLQRRFRKQNGISYCPNNFTTILSEAVGRFAEQLLNQALIYRTQYYSLLKYDSLYMLNLMQNQTLLNGIHQQFKDAKLSLLKKKEKLYGEGNVSKWELQYKIDKNNKQEVINAMIPKQTKKVAKIREVFGLFNYQMYEEILRYFTTKNIYHGQRLQQICRNQTRLCSEMMMIWVDAETNLMGMRQNKAVIKV